VVEGHGDEYDQQVEFVLQAATDNGLDSIRVSMKSGIAKERAGRDLGISERKPPIDVVCYEFQALGRER
jgi:hypothetical protein